MYEAFVIWAVLSTLYLLTLAGNYTETEDGLGYLVAIRSGNPSDIFQVHLGFRWLGWSAYHIALISGYDGGPLLPLQVLNAFTGALGVALLWALLRMVAPGRVAAAAGCGTLAFSYGYWWYSVLPDVYITSALLLICSLFFAYRASVRPSWKTFALLGVAHALAVLVHLINVLFVIVPIVAVLFAWRELASTRDVMRCALAYASVSFSVGILPYVLINPGIFRPAAEIAYYLLSSGTHGASGSDEWGTWEASNIPEAVVGIGRALIGGHFALSLGPLQDFVADNLPAGKVLREELYLVRDFNPVLAVLLLALVIVVALALLIPVLKYLRHPALDRHARVLATLCVSWLIPYALFFTWWEPLNIEFWIALWVPLATFFALPFSTGNYMRRRFPPSTVVVLVGGLFVVNLLGSVWPQHDPENDYWRVRMSWYERNTTPSDLIVATEYMENYYLRYFTPATVLVIGTSSVSYDDKSNRLAELERQIDASPAQRVLFTSEVFYPLSDEFSSSRCPNSNVSLECENAAALRDVFLHRTHIVDNEPLEEIRELDRR